MGASLGTTAREPRGKSTSVMLRSRLEGNEGGLGRMEMYFTLQGALRNTQGQDKVKVKPHPGCSRAGYWINHNPVDNC